MSIEFILYLAGISNGLKLVLGFLGGGLLLAALFATAEVICSRKAFLMLTIGGVFAFLICALLPTEKSIYLMAGANLGKQVVQSDTVTKAHKLLDLKLDELIEQAQKGAQ